MAGKSSLSSVLLLFNNLFMGQRDYKIQPLSLLCFATIYIEYGGCMDFNLGSFQNIEYVYKSYRIVDLVVSLFGFFCIFA